MILPDSFAQRTEQMMGSGLFGRFVKALDEEPPVSIRINGKKWNGCPVVCERVPWCASGYYLSSRPAFTFDPLLHAGCYYVQEASSMFVAHVISEYVDKPVAMLDLCAAPGGKSTAALSALPDGSMLVCNEPVRQRANILVENICKWGSPNVVVTNNFPVDFVSSGILFDVILCDVPCSGEGMFRKDDGAVGEWSVQGVEACGRLQREIVGCAWRCLRPGGLLIYSTCTFNTAENEENISWMCDNLGAEPLPSGICEEWGITGSLLDGFSEPVCRFIPGVSRGEGLFMAALRKPDDGSASVSCLSVEHEAGSKLLPSKMKRKAGRQRKNNKADKMKLPVHWLLDDTHAFDFSMRGDIIEAVPDSLRDIYKAAVSRLKVLSAGVTVGCVKGRDIVPDASLALSTLLNRDAFHLVELSYADAVSYLRRDSITLPADTPRGYVLVTYRGVVLGFMKNIGNRANNLYPQEWKIKSTHVPDMPHVID